jgi:hypothetical protein
MARELVMFDNTALARIGALVGDPGRASMLAALRSRPWSSPRTGG